MTAAALVTLLEAKAAAEAAEAGQPQEDENAPPPLPGSEVYSGVGGNADSEKKKPIVEDEVLISAAACLARNASASEETEMYARAVASYALALYHKAGAAGKIEGYGDEEVIAEVRIKAPLFK